MMEVDWYIVVRFVSMLPANWIWNRRANSNRMNHTTKGGATRANQYSTHSLQVQVPTVLLTTQNISVFFFMDLNIYGINNYLMLAVISGAHYNCIVRLLRPSQVRMHTTGYYCSFTSNPRETENVHRDFGIASPPHFPRPSNWPLRLNAPHLRFLSRRRIALPWRPIPWSHRLPIPVVWGKISAGRWPSLRRNVLQV